MKDEDLVGRLREAVHREAAAVPGSPYQLACRLTGGIRQARRRRTGAVAAAVVLAVAVSGTGALLLRSGEDRLVGLDSAGVEPPGDLMSVSEATAVTPEMAAREGLDGSPQCGEVASEPQPRGAGVAPGLTPYAAFLTDGEGYERWSAEFSRMRELGGVAPAPSLLVLCWYTGDVPRDLSAGGPGLPKPTHQLVVLQLRGPAETSGVRMTVTAPRPLPVLAPDPPRGLASDDPIAGQELRAFPQPEGVAVVDELPRRPPPSTQAPVDCTPTACTDPTEGTVVRAELAVDGEKVHPTAVRELRAGEQVEVTVSLGVEEGQTLRDVHLGISDGGHGGGPDGPIGLDEVLLRLPEVSGERTLSATWTVPADTTTRQVVLYYAEDKYQQVMHSRTLGGLVASNP